MKKTLEMLKKVLICLLIFLILNNFFIGNFSPIFVYASGATNTNTTTQEPSDDIGDIIANLLGTVVGLFTWPLRLVAMALGYGVSSLMNEVANIPVYGNSEETEDPDNSGDNILSPDDILFNTDNNNSIQLLNINFFNMENISQDSILYKFRTGIAFWYYAMRNIAAAILLCVLLYVGIRMALSTVSAQQKASYKKMLVDWVVSLAIIFVLQYVIIFTIYVNNAIVDAIRALAKEVSLNDFINSVGKAALEISVVGIAATVIYCVLVYQTFGLFISYFNRMLKLAFLIIISPLITLTYSIDKMGDGKSQALNTWLKEYVYSILMQPFHCIIYMVFIGAAAGIFKQIDKSSGFKAIAAGVIAILCVNFVRQGEKIVKDIFAFGNDDSTTSLAAGMAIAAATAKKGRSIGQSTRKAITGVKDAGIKAKNLVSTGKVEALAVARMMTGRGEGKSFDEIKSDVRTEEYEKQADRESNKRYGVYVPKDGEKVDEKLKGLADEVSDRAKKFMQEGMSSGEAKARARAEIAREKRKSKKESAMDAKHKTIKKVRGTLNSAKSVLKQSEVLKAFGDYAKFSVAAGVGLHFGSGVYGATGNVSEGVFTGVGTYRGTQEFMKSSTNTLKTDVLQRLQGLGISGRTEALGKMNEIAMNGNKYEGTDELDKIMKELEKALEQAGVNGKVKTNIKNTIQKAVTKDPSADIGSIVSNALSANGVSAPTAGLTQAATNLAKFTQEKGIYDSMKQAGDIGLSPDAFISDVSKSYHGTSNTSTTSGSYITDKEFLSQAVSITVGQDGREERFVAPSDDSAREFVESRNEADLNAFYKECDREMDRTTRDIEKESDENAKTDLIAKLNQIEAARAKVQDLEFDRAVEKMRKEYQAMVDKLAGATAKEAQGIINTQLSRLQGDYNRYINQANDQLKRGEMEGTKSRTEITAQKMKLEQELGEVENLKNRYSRPSGGGTH